MTVDQRTLDQIALSWDEYRLACERLDREPNDVELGMIGALCRSSIIRTLGFGPARV